MTKKLSMKIKMIALAAVLLGAASVFVPGAALADSTGLLYSYNLRNAGVAVENGAVNAPSSTLNLVGDFSNEQAGTRFIGNTQSGVSAGYAVASEGFTLDVGVDRAFGVGAVFTADFAGSTCLVDSQNITQVGRFAPGQSQVKLQLSKCDDASGNVQPECRITGVDSPDGTAILKGRRVVEDGHTYSFTCVKNIQSNGVATVKLTTTDLVTGSVDVKYHGISATGIIVSDKVLSVANQFPLPAQADNSDQFNGLVASVSYCEGVHVGAVNSCLEEGLGDTTVEEPETPIVETDLEIAAGHLDVNKIDGPKWRQDSWVSEVNGQTDVTFNWENADAEILFQIINLTTGDVVMWPGNNQPGYASGIIRSFEAIEGDEYALQSWAKSGTSAFDVQLSW